MMLSDRILWNLWTWLFVIGLVAQFWVLWFKARKHFNSPTTHELVVMWWKGEVFRRRVSLPKIVDQIPEGHVCLKCGLSSATWIGNIDTYQRHGDTCCRDFQNWVNQAKRTK
jgi:hypothetical protein